MNKKTITQIPIPSVILNGDWYGTVYAIDIVSLSLAEHLQSVEESIQEIIKDFNNNSHYTVSLREVKRELVFTDEMVQRYCTLAQFRVRDSY